MWLPDLRGGGAERIAVHLANGLAERGYPMTLVLGEATGPYLADVSSGVHVVELRRRHTRTSVLPLVGYLRRESPDVLFSHLDHVNVGALLARRLAGVSTQVVPVVHIAFSQSQAHSRLRRTWLLGPAIRRLYPSAARIVVVSQGAADDMVRSVGVPPSLIRVIYNPVITPQMKMLAEEPAGHPWFAEAAPRVILGVGRLTRQKDFATLIRAFAILQAVDYRLLILGDGEDRESLEGLVKDLRLTERVAMPGFVKNPFSYLARSSLFVLSSAWEALPTVLIEALHLGVPVVSTDCESGPREILHNGNYGRLVPVGDADALSKAMGDALAGPRPEVPESALQPYSSNFAVERYVELIREITHA